MSDFNKDIDKMFIDSIEVHEMEPEGIVWNSIENRLEKKKSDELKRKNSKLIAIILFLSLFILLLSVSIFERESTNGNNSIVSLSNQQDDSTIRKEHKGKTILKDSNLPTSDSFHNSNLALNIDSTEKQKSFPQKNSSNQTITVHQEKLIKTNFGIGNNLMPNSQKSATSYSSHNSEPQLANGESTDRLDSINLKATRVFLQSINYYKLLQTDTSFPTVVMGSALPSIDSDFGKRYITGYFAPEFVSSKLFDNDHTDSQNEGDYKSSESPDFSFSTGVKFGYQFKPKWNFSIGCSFSSITFGIRPKLIYAKQVSPGINDYSLTTTSGTVNLTSPTATQIGDSVQLNSNSFQQLRFIGIPVTAEFHIRKSRFDYFIWGGVSANFFLSGLTEVNLENMGMQSSTRIQGLNKMYISGICGLGIQYNFYKNFGIEVSPSFSRAFTPLNRNTPVTSYPVSFGITTGLNIRF